VVQRVRAVAEQHRHRLAQIQDAAATDRDDHVGARGPRLIGRGADIIHRRLMPDGHDGDRAGVTQEMAVAGRNTPGTQQRLDPQGGHHRGELVSAARAEHDPPRQSELEHAHQPSSPGKTATNRVDVRGSAIIPATASRQRA
jgi:hypothetical protein